MAIVWDATSVCAGAANPLVCNHTTGVYPGLILTVGISTRWDGAVGRTLLNTVTYGGVLMTPGPDVAWPLAVGQHDAWWYYLVNPPTGLNALAVNWAPAFAGTNMVWNAVSYSGVDQNFPLGVGVSAIDFVNAVIGLNVASAVGELVVTHGSEMERDCTVTVAGPGETDRGCVFFGVGGARTASSRSDELGAAGVVPVQWTFTANDPKTMYGISMRPLVPPRTRAAKYYFNIWDPKPRVRDIIDQVIPSNELRADVWLELQGAKLPTSTVYDSYVQDPSKARVVEVTDRKNVTLKASHSQFADVLIKRAAAGRG